MAWGTGEDMISCWGGGIVFSKGLRNGEDEGSLYIPGGVPLQSRTPLLEAMSLLRQNSPSIGQGKTNGMELLCDK